MHCAYCGVDYNWDEACLCLPHARDEVVSVRKISGPWGEAALEWSLQTRDRRLWLTPTAEA